MRFMPAMNLRHVHYSLRRGNKDKLRRCEEFGADILKYCVKVGGALTGEHGVGIEKGTDVRSIQ